MWALADGAMEALTAAPAEGEGEREGELVDRVRARMRLCGLVAKLPSFEASAVLTAVHKLRGEWLEQLATAQLKLVRHLGSGLANDPSLKELLGGELLPMAVVLVRSVVHARGGVVKEK